MRTFAQEDIRNLYDRIAAEGQLRALGDAWIGPDVVLQGKVVIPPLRIFIGVPIVLSNKDFPGIELTRGALGSFDWSVRSCLAQSGVEVRFHRSDVSDVALRDIRKGKKVTVPVDIQNHTNRPIELKDRIMRFFWVNDIKRLRHGELRRTIGSGFEVDGLDGKDWSFGDVDMEDDCASMVRGADPSLLKDVCIILPFKARFYIPRSKEPIRTKSKKDLPRVLRKIPRGREPGFVIGETAKVKLSPGIVAVINTGVYGRDQRHVRSPLIDPGYEGIVRTETLGGLDHIEFFLYRYGSR